MAIWCRSGATATMPWSLSTYTTAQTAHTTTRAMKVVASANATCPKHKSVVQY